VSVISAPLKTKPSQPKNKTMLPLTWSKHVENIVKRDGKRMLYQLK